LRGLDRQRGETFISEIINLRAHRAQRVDQIANRALVHARHAPHLVMAIRERQRGGQRAKGRAGIAEKQICFLCGKKPADARYGKIAALAMLSPFNAQRFERFEHALRIVGSQQPFDFGCALRQRGQQQDTVGNAFGTGQNHRAVHAGNRGKIKKFHGQLAVSRGQDRRAQLQRAPAPDR